MKEISQLENAEEFTKLPNSWEERGIRKGREEGREEIAFEMLKEGLPVDLIEKVTHLNKEAVEKLREKLND